MSRIAPRPRRARLAAVTALAVAAVTLLGACAGPAEETSGPTTLHFLACCSEDLLKTVIAEFEDANPDITIEQEVVPFENLNDLIVSRLSGGDDSFDFYEADQPRTAALASAGYLTDLTDTYGKDAQGVLFDSSLAASTFEGKVWSAPLWSSSQVLYYNSALLAQAGLTAPGIDPADRITWQQLESDALTATGAGAECGVMFDQPDRYYQLQPIIESAGGGSGLTGDDLLTPDVTNDGWKASMNFYSDLFKSGASPRGIPAEQSRALFADGKCAYFVGIPALSEFTAAGIDYGIAPVPYFEGGDAATPSDSFALGVNPNSKKQDAVLRFLEFATLTTDGNLAAVADNPNPTPNKEASPLFFEKVEAGDPHLAGIGDLVTFELGNTVVHRPPSTGYVKFETVIGNAFSDIRNGEDVQATLQSAQDELTAQLSR